MSRKAKLHERAARFSDRMQKLGAPWDNAHDGFVGGYRAAMRDARKALALHLRPVYRDDPIVQFLRPLR